MAPACLKAIPLRAASKKGVIIFQNLSKTLDWVEFETTAICNAPLFLKGFKDTNGQWYPSACKYCYQKENQISKEEWQKQKSLELKKEDYFRIFSQMKELGISRACMLGGEPFLRPDIVDILNFAYKTIDYIQVNTNAFNIVDKIDSLEKSHGINISLDCHLPEIAYKTRPRPLVDEAIKAFQKLPQKGIFTSINAVLSKYNYNHISDFIDFSFDKGVKIFNIYCLMKDVDHELVINQEELNKLYEKLSEKFDVELQTFCKGGRHIYVEAQGLVIPCAGFIGKNQSIGNLKEKNLAEILKNEKFQNLSYCDFKPSENNIDDFSKENGCLAINYWENLNNAPKAKDLLDEKYCLRCNKKIVKENICPRCEFDKFGKHSIRMACHEITVFAK